MRLFEELGVSAQILQALKQMGFEEATPIQESTIPLLMTGKDVIGQAQTGTGKTAAFGIPMIEKLSRDENYVQGLVVAPTRELAVQVAEELNRVGQVKGIRALPIYGGQEIGRQIKALRANPQIVSGTPGRLLDHIRRRTLRLDGIKMVVLDEADEMLNMGFIEDIEAILKEVPQERQTLLFSATMPAPIRKLGERFMKEPEMVKIEAKEMTVDLTDQCYIEVLERKKFDILCNMLDIHSPELAIVFGRTKKRVDEVFEALQKRGYSAEALHGDLTQSRRDQVMRRFKQNRVDILVATDVAARGLDISGVTHVYNFDIPQDPESYVHRVGRTGRAGKTGEAITFVTSREMDHLRLIETSIRKKIQRRQAPTLTDALMGQQQTAVEKLLESIERQDYLEYQETSRQLLEEHDSTALVAAALKMITKEPVTIPVSITEHAPLRSKKTQQSSWKGGSKSGGGYKGKSSGSSGGGGYKGKSTGGYKGKSTGTGGYKGKSSERSQRDGNYSRSRKPEDGSRGSRWE
ncbi:DEAD/DEAH box helicase [Anoxynatronum buryatiense]|uniref:DEAD-box ATP-dependent RNA helicase CshA n=1 Tax=Anoxynatronum buryatiense TaxID=489973 RepID=A0AA45WVM5_9CLOT|nr:DEAD/DEAH box helicase [Anoxynatronum buryatiense]SMP54598.1 ATP-dependent RNA helicase DeaD [Anoxynatronum buryatiense]